MKIKRIGRKIQSSNGMTLSEVLIAVLLLTLATGIIANCISLGTRLFHREMRVSQAQMLMDALTVSIEDELRYATGIKGTTAADGQSEFSYSSRNRAGKKNCVLAVDSGRIVLVSGDIKYDLVSQRLYKGLEVELTQAEWDANANEFLMGITVKDASAQTVITSKEFVVGAFNGDYNMKN